MKTPSNEVFDIIKSLTAQEKRFFRLFSQQNSDYTNYLKLFDIIEEQKVYDEKIILIDLKLENKKNQFKKLKSYLQETLYSFLENYFSDYSVEIKLQRLLQRIEILVAKKLFIPAKKWIEKAEEIAVEHHQYFYLQNILSWKRLLSIRKADVPGNSMMQKNYSMQFYFLELYKNELEYQQINTKVDVYLNLQENLDYKAKKSLKKILQLPLLKDEKEALSISAKIRYCNVLGTIYYLLKDWSSCYYYYKRQVGYFEQNKLSPERQLSAYSSLAAPLRELKKEEELIDIKNATLKLIRSLPKKSQTAHLLDKYLMFMNTYIAYYLAEFNLKQSLLVSDEINEDVDKYSNNHSMVIFYFNRFLMFFFKADFRKAVQCCNKVLLFEKAELRQDVISFMKLLNLVVHYELRNEELLLNLSKSYLPYFKKQLNQQKSSKTLLKFFGKAIHKNTTKEKRISAFVGLKKELELCKNENIFNQFDFISWADSKIQNRPMIEILQEKL